MSRYCWEILSRRGILRAAAGLCLPGGRIERRDAGKAPKTR